MAEPSYHLWWKPAGEASTRLAQAIEELAQMLRAPVFQPHVTLLGNLIGTEADHHERARALAQQLDPFPIVLTKPAYGDQYFQCIFMKVEETASVMNAHAAAKRLCPHAEAPPYLPHLSLVYGQYPVEVKKAIIMHLPSHLTMSFDASTVYLIRADSREPKDWHQIAAVPLGKDLLPHSHEV
jgi:2'-5' RNA ligase